ncbi:MAG TPA: SCO family protein [Gemmataceae bacterium]|nr:SCO family protein [Gemmataceae bacterium]
MEIWPSWNFHSTWDGRIVGDLMTFGLFCAVFMVGNGLTEKTGTTSRLAVIRSAPDFTLLTSSGEPRRSTDLRGKVVLVSFIFTTCNGTCPATTHRMSQVQQELKTRGLCEDDRVRLLSITLDPVRDTPEVLKAYQRLYDVDTANWSFLTGPADQVASTIQAWGMWARPAANGQLDHPSRVFLVDSRGRIREIYNLEFLKPAWVAEDVELLLKEAANARQ